MKIILIITIFLCFEANAMLNLIDPYSTFTGESCNDLETFEVKSMPPVRNQGMLNLCTEFSIVTLLDKHVCKNSTCGQLYSTLGLVDQMYDGVIVHKGTKTVKATLTTLSKQNKLAYESCQPFAALNSSLDMTYTDGRETFSFYDPDGSWNVIKMLYNRIKTTNLDACDGHRQISKILPNLNQSFGGFLDALASDKFEVFFGNYLLKQCREQKQQLPNYTVKTHSGSTNNLIAKSKELSLKGTPFSFSACVEFHPIIGCRYAHDMVITGFKKRCCGTICKKLVRVHNSYGQEWQDSHDGGWVIADKLFDKNSIFVNGSDFTWIE